MRSSNLLVALGAFFVLTGCQTMVDVEQRAIDGREKLELGLGESDLLTVRLQNDLRIVVRDIVLKNREWCFVELASRGASRHDDYWREFDRFGSGPRNGCVEYEAIKSVRVGDARLCEGLACIFD